LNEFEAWQKILEHWKQVDKMKQLNQRLYDELGGALMYILDYADRNSIVLPNRDRLFRMIDNIHNTTDAIMDYHNKINSPANNTHLSTPKNDTPEDDNTEIDIAQRVISMTMRF
jgi:hypothetical protein